MTRPRTSGPAPAGRERFALDSAAGRWIVVASVLGSGAVFLESTVVTVALPAIAREFDLDLGGLQWVVDGYLLTLGALMLLGGSLGDRLGRRRVFAWGAVAFAIISALCAIAPTLLVFLGLRLLQGAAGALLVPNSLTLLESSFEGEEQGVAIGRWAGWSAVSTAAGPLLGGWVVDAMSWRWVFGVITPVSLAAGWIIVRQVPTAERGENAGRANAGRANTGRANAGRANAGSYAGSPGTKRIDWLGATLATTGLGAIVWALIEGPRRGVRDPAVLATGLGGLACLAVFILVERRTSHPLLPLTIFRSRQSTGTNIVTLLVYAPLGALFFLLILQLQNVLGYSALEAGAAILPINVIMLALSPSAGRVSARIGPRAPMAIGSLVAGIGLLLMARVQDGTAYVETALPALVVLGVGLAILVAPLTAAVLGAVDESEVGVASAVNNAVARLAGLLAIAALPLAAGIAGSELTGGEEFATGFARAMWIGAALCAAAAVVAFLTVRRGGRAVVAPHPSPSHACVGAGPSD